jgi:CMP-N-acetylneuraminic acid synthetase
MTDVGCLAFHQENTSDNRQAQPLNYQLNGAIYIASPARYHADALLTQPVYPYVMSPDVSVDIDTLSDFMWADFMLAENLLNHLDLTSRLSATLVGR